MKWSLSKATQTGLLVLGLMLVVFVTGCETTSNEAKYVDSKGKDTVVSLDQINIQDWNQAAEQMKDMAEQMKAAAEGKGAAATDPASLQALLPATLPGYSRTEVSSAGGAAGVMNASTAKGIYEKGDSRVELTVSDLGVAGAMAGMVKVNANRETATSYEKVSTINGRMTTEEFHKDSNNGKYSVLVGSRFMVEADGSHVSMDDMKAAVNAVPVDRLEAMARG